MTKKKVTNKAVSTPDTPVPTTTEVGRIGLESSGNFIKKIRKKQLQMPNRLCTFEQMMANSAVSASVHFTNMGVVAAMTKGMVHTKGKSAKAKDAAEFLNYCFFNMPAMSWFEHCNDASTDVQNGFALGNIVLEKALFGKYKGRYVLKKIAPREQKSVYGWVFDDQGRDFLGFIQKPTLLNTPAEPKRGDGFESIISNANVQSILDKGSYTYLDKARTLHYRFNPKNGDPEGDSPLNSCFNAFIEMELVQEYEIIGVSKDLGGLPVLRVPKGLLNMINGNDPSKAKEASDQLAELERQVANLHAGEQSYIMLTSDPVSNNSNFREYEVELLDSGGGKQFDTTKIIDQKRKEIYNVFGTGHMLLGQGNVGSNALSEGAKTTHDTFVERIILEKETVINHQLIPRLLAANGIYLDYKDMPFFKAERHKELDLDTVSKFLQRAGSVQKLTPEIMTELCERANLPIDGIEDLDYSTKGDSRAGEGLGTSGTGQIGSNSDSSVANTENSGTKSVEKFFKDHETEDQIIAVSSEGKTIFIEKE